VTIAELITELQKLPPGAEVALLAASAWPRPPVAQKVNQWAHDVNTGRPCGFKDPSNAYLLRPAPETI
jgi:hypothetical protein